jgi:hypothetical protein
MENADRSFATGDEVMMKKMRKTNNRPQAIRQVVARAEAILALIPKLKSKSRSARLARAEREVSAARKPAAKVKAAPARQDDDRRHIACKSDHLERGARLTRAELGDRKARNRCDLWRA